MEETHKKLCETHQLGSETREWLVVRHRGGGNSLSDLHAAGHTEARAGYDFVRISPPFGGVLVTLGGNGRVWVGGKWEDCREGQAYVFSPRAFSAYHIAKGRSWKLCWVLYGEKLLPPGLTPGEASRVASVEPEGLRLAIEGLCREDAGTAEPSVEGLWRELVDRMVLRLLGKQEGDIRLTRLWAAVRENPAADWSVRVLARRAGMSAENLRRLCLRQTGHSPAVWVTSLRVAAAKTLLLHSYEKIASVGARVGYSDAFAFSTAFRRATGSSPRAFRRGG